LYKYYTISKNYIFRKILQKLHFLLIIAIPVSFLVITPSLNLFVNGLLLLGLIILLLNFYKTKKKTGHQQLDLIDWVIIGGTNLYISGFVFLSGRNHSPLFIILILPMILFSLEFGLLPGIISISFLTFFLILNLWQTSFALISVLSALIYLLVSVLILKIIYTQHKILARYHQKIKNMIFCDALTGLYNRQYLKTIILEAINKDQHFSLIMMDINYFKYYNDHWGHFRGDNLLKIFGRFLKSVIHGSGTVMRVSGDEFFIFVPNMSPENVNHLVKQIQEQIPAYPFPGEECFPQKGLSISFGIVSFPEQAAHLDELLDQADQELYKNKKQR
jgi:diguanylate cyclase (GGDEF)-like protein